MKKTCGNSERRFHASSGVPTAVDALLELRYSAPVVVVALVRSLDLGFTKYKLCNSVVSIHHAGCVGLIHTDSPVTRLT